MPGKVITTSPNISLLDIKVVGDLCQGKFFVDLIPSTFLGSGATEVLGAKVKIVNPFGVKIKDYGAGYDIAPPMSAIYEMNVPTQAGLYQYGDYNFYVELTDEDGTKYEVTKARNICASPDMDECKNGVQMVADCANGRLNVVIAEPPAYQQKLAESRTSDWTLLFPHGYLAPIISTNTNFQAQLFEGEYKLTGSFCATYNFGDNVYVKLGYTGEWEKKVKCVLNYSAIYPKLAQLQKKITQDCSEKEMAETQAIIFNTLWLLELIEITLAHGKDASEPIKALEDLLGCSCTGSLVPSSPIINGSPSTSVNITGCGVEKTIDGLTHNYLINNYHYIVKVAEDQSIITISNPALTNCIYEQTINFSPEYLYTSLIEQITTPAQSNFWASVINDVLDDLPEDIIIALGYTVEEWLEMSFEQRFAAVAQMAGTATCPATIDTNSVVRLGDGVIISWTHTGAFEVAVYLDDTLKGRVLVNTLSAFIGGVSDGLPHNYLLIPVCQNGIYGLPVPGTFTYIACPSISPPAVSANVVNEADCPYDLTSLLTTVPLGITVEWHTANNAEPSTLVATPTAVTSGVYFAFAKNNQGCISSATQVTLVCADDDSCSAPQSLTVAQISGGFLIQFQSAAFPPPGNSYTVKRRIQTDPDVVGSYVTIGTPTFNSSSGRWEILDATPAPSTLYVYRAQSNCDGGGTPYVDYEYASVACTTATLTPTDTTVLYSFLPIGSAYITKYEIRLFDASYNQLSMQTDIAPYAIVVAGEFIYLTANTLYRVRVRVYMGDYYHDCPYVNVTTTNAGPATINWDFDELAGADGTLVIDKNGSNVLTQTVAGSGTLPANAGDVLDITVLGTGGVNRYLKVESTIPLYEETDNLDLSNTQGVAAGVTYTITSYVEDVS